MAIRVNPHLIDELARYGAEDVHKCYHCGNCSAVCPHSEEPFVLPRKVMRNLQMGSNASSNHPSIHGSATTAGSARRSARGKPSPERR